MTMSIKIDYRLNIQKSKNTSQLHPILLNVAWYEYDSSRVILYPVGKTLETKAVCKEDKHDVRKLMVRDSINPLIIFKCFLQVMRENLKYQVLVEAIYLVKYR